MAYGYPSPGSEYALTAAYQENQRKLKANSAALAARTGGGGGGINSFDPAAPVAPLPDLTRSALTNPLPGPVGQNRVVPASPASIGAVPVETGTLTPAPSIAQPLTRAATQMPKMTVMPTNADTAAAFPASNTAQAWTGGGSTATGQKTLPGGISMIKGADDVPIFTNIAQLTQAQLAQGGGKLAPTADQSLTLPGIASLVRDGSGNYTGGTIGVPGSNDGQLTRTQMPGSPGAVAGYDPSSEIAAAQLDRQSDIASILNKDPRSVLGTAARNAAIDANSYVSRIGNRSNRARTTGDPNAAIGELIGGVNSDFGARTTAALTRSKEESDTNRTNIAQLGELQREGLRNQSALAVANTRGDALRDVAQTRADTPKINGPLEHAHAMIYKARLDAGDSPEDAQAAADAYRPPGSAPPAADASPATPGVPKGAKDGDMFQDKNGNKVVIKGGKAVPAQ